MVIINALFQHKKVITCCLLHFPRRMDSKFASSIDHKHKWLLFIFDCCSIWSSSHIVHIVPACLPWGPLLHIVRLVVYIAILWPEIGNEGAAREQGMLRKRRNIPLTISACCNMWCYKTSTIIVQNINFQQYFLTGWWSSSWSMVASPLMVWKSPSKQRRRSLDQSFAHFVRPCPSMACR